ncbi:amidase [Ruegeria profundi]|uniref:Amidase n=1 Tax=Ruegeria profundi TaxID=1685378 RepID=A0A0X3TRW8_9RHOB|nr:amidase [Ruegeria profundi]KUJ78483.1 amidase [Ruegeria profundi]
MFQKPTVEQVQETASELGMALPPEKAAAFLNEMGPVFEAYDLLDSLDDDIPPVNYPRGEIVEPSPSENDMNAWTVKVRIDGAPEGKLFGKTVGIKDNVNLAGVPMANGSPTLAGHVPAFDATVVTRLLDEGASIVGKTTCECFCLSAGSHTSWPLPVHNPHLHGFSAGGSSSGSAALLACGEIDLAIGGDQGGSIRVPAAFCGVVGMKPTYGLVPYSGIMPIEATVDHVGPMSRNVRDNAQMLEVLAGKDGLDPRQSVDHKPDYTASLGRGVDGLKVGILKEGFELPLAEKDVTDATRSAAEKLAENGAVVEEFSLPEHHVLAALWAPLGMEGLTAQMMLGNGMGYNWKGLYDVGLMEAHKDWRSRADELSTTLRIAMIVGRYAQKNYFGTYYAKGQNIVRRLTRKYDEAFAKYDVILTPTVVMKATRLPGPDADVSEIAARAWEMLGATSQYDLTGHPALSLPYGYSDGLPIGVSIASAAYREDLIYQVAAVLEAD